MKARLILLLVLQNLGCSFCDGEDKMVWVVMIVRDSTEYFGYVSRTEDKYNLDGTKNFTISKIEGNDCQNRPMLIDLHQNCPSGESLMEMSLTVDKIQQAAIAQIFDNDGFTKEKYDWIPITVEHIEEVADHCPLTMKCIEPKKEVVPFVLTLGGYIIKGNVTVAKSMSTQDEPKLSEVDAPNGWNGRLSLIYFNVTFGTVLDVRKILLRSTPDFRIVLFNIQYQLKVDKIYDSILQGIVFAKRNERQVLAIHIGEEKYYGFAYEIRGPHYGNFYMDINTIQKKDLVLYVDGPSGKTRKTLSSISLDISRITRASLALQIMERGSFVSEELNWSPIYIIDCQQKLNKELAQLTYFVPKIYPVVVEFSGTEPGDIFKKATMFSQLGEHDVLNNEYKVGEETKSQEVILQWNEELPHAIDYIGETANQKVFVSFVNDETKIGRRRVLLISEYMGSKLKFVAKIMPVQVKLSIQENDKKPLYVLDGIVDEMNMQITIQYNAVAKVNGTPDGKFGWKECVEKQEKRNNYTFRMHQPLYDFNVKTGINLEIIDNPLQGNFVGKWIRKTVVINYK